MRRLLREPLVHFLLLGALLFAWFEWRGGGSGPGSTRISITPGLVEHLAAGFTRTWQRPPTDDELKGLIDEHVKEEIATREALGLGLDRDDTIVRRRLRQKLEFLVEDEAGMLPPDDAELRAWLAAHPDAFRAEPSVSLRQVYFDAARLDDASRTDIRQLLARLRGAGPDADLDGFGDASLLPQELPLGPLSEVARNFGADFAERIAAIPAGEWSGPVESSYGLHLVLVEQRIPARQPVLEEIRPLVEREWLVQKRRERMQAFYDRMLEKYTVEIEMPREPPVTQGGAETAP